MSRLLIMSEPLKLLSFNALTSFGDPSRQQSAIELVHTLSPDVAFFPEAYRHDDSRITIDASIVALRALGYEITSGLTDDIVKRTDGTGFFGIVKPEVGKGSILRIGHRQGFIAEVTEPSTDTLIHIGGVHFDDRNEPARLAQIEQLPETIDVLMGDMNAMHKKTPIARALRIVSPIVSLLPEVDPDFSVTKFRPKQYISLAQRLTRMADGRTLENLQNKFGLHDADSHHRPTIHGVAQIDHILAKDTIEVSDFQVHNEISLSDHKPISATIRLK